MRGRAVSGLSFVSLLITAAATAGVGVWTTNGPHVKVYGIVTDFRTPGLIYTGSDTALFRSTDNGATWQLTSTPAGNSEGLTALSTAPSTTIYASGPYVTGDRGPTDALFVSRNQGSNWSVLTYGQASTSYLLAVDPVTPTNLYLATYFIFSVDETSQFTRSTDGGNTWSPSGPNEAKIIDIKVAPTAPSTVYLASIPFIEQPNGGAPGFWRSLDSGATWSPNASLLSVSALAVDPTNSSTVYAASESGVLKSLDGGNTFVSANSGLPTGAYVSNLCIDPTRPNRIYAATSSGVFISIDAGASWQDLNNGLSAASRTGITGLALDPTGQYLHVATGSGVFDYEFTSFPCGADASTLCLNNGRFSVTADFQTTPSGPSIPATAVPLTGDTGYFWFFDPSNIELVTKVLTGCTVNGEYWAFASGLTNVGVQINVTDTVTGATKPYSNTFGTPFQPIQDTSAFTCP